jgi:methylmalonyl-CoA/ethylmalonyl-CoA epimerase
MRLSQIGQISLTVDNIDNAEHFYGETLGLDKLYRFGDLVFFDCSGVRLFITKSEKGSFSPESSVLYFKTTDIANAFKEMKSKGVSFIHEPHLISEMEDHDLWMAFFKDPSGNTLAIIHEAPKGYKPLF